MTLERTPASGLNTTAITGGSGLTSIFDGEQTGRGFYATTIRLSNFTSIVGGIIRYRIDVDGYTMYFKDLTTDSVNQFSPMYFIPFVPCDTYNVRVGLLNSTAEVNLEWVLYKQPQA